MTLPYAIKTVKRNCTYVILLNPNKQLIICIMYIIKKLPDPQLIVQTCLLNNFTSATHVNNVNIFRIIIRRWLDELLPTVRESG